MKTYNRANANTIGVSGGTGYTTSLLLDLGSHG